MSFKETIRWMKWWELSLDVALIFCLAANLFAALHGYVINMIVVNVVVLALGAIFVMQAKTARLRKETARMRHHDMSRWFNDAD